tara:strand:- start:2361 stop:2480 length:120 start_codon:yes stop_codon:yes gene_type:complete
MYRFLLGFASGVYVGTNYHCKPIIDKLKKVILEHLPSEK